MSNITDIAVSKDELKILLLKCIGSRYPIKLYIANGEQKAVFIKGFHDAGCSTLMVSKISSPDEFKIEVDHIVKIKSLKPISFHRLKGNTFSVN